MNGLLKTQGIKRCHLLVAALLSGLFLWLAVQAGTERYHWSYWGFGDAQTMLTLNQWQKGGWLHNYLLFKPQGWAPTVDLLDEPELRHHARGISPASSPRVGPRLWYTHYPAGYLIPYAALYALGLTSLYGLQLFAMGISLAALGLMYVAFSLITDASVALVAVAFYGGSTLFLGYADSLANQPVDDLLRFGCMVAVIMSSRAAGVGRQRWWLATAWTLEFALSLASFDSVFFLYIWLVGWDLLERRGLRWRKWLLFALAPILAHSLQFLQNVWYLGWHDAAMDIMDAFMMKSSPGWLDLVRDVPPTRLAAMAMSFLQIFSSIYSPSFLLFVPLLVYIGYRKLYPLQGQGLPSAGLLLLLFCCGLGFIQVLPVAASMDYEGRQMMPFVAMLVGGYTCAVIRLARRWPEIAGSGAGGRSRGRKLLPFGVALLAGGSLLLFWGGFLGNNRYPSPWAVGDDAVGDLEFAQQLRELSTSSDPVFFVLGGLNYKKQDHFSGYPTVDPDTEYYAGSHLLLCFNTPELLASDLLAMLRLTKGEARFSPVLISDRPGSLREAVAAIERQGGVTAVPQSILSVQGRFVLDLTPYLDWNRKVPLGN